MSQAALTVGTEYTERMMSGTGTESDPWIIGGGDDEQNFQNFLDGVITASAFVKIEKDVDVSQSITYREGLTHSIVINCTKLYADEKVKISGIRVNGAKFMETNGVTGSGLRTVENIQILSAINENNDDPCFYAPGKALSLLFLNCDFSVWKRNGYAGFSMYSVGFEGCSIYYDASNSIAGRVRVFSTNQYYRKCSIWFDGPVRSIAFSIYELIGDASYVGVVGNIPAVMENIYIFSNCQNCYFAGSVDCNKLDATIGNYGQTCTNCLTCITEVTGNYTLTKSSNMTEVTPDQLRDRDYLYSIGFLP